MASNNSNNSVKHKINGYDISYHNKKNKWQVKKGRILLFEGKSDECKKYAKQNPKAQDKHGVKKDSIKLMFIVFSSNEEPIKIRVENYIYALHPDGWAKCGKVKRNIDGGEYIEWYA